MIKREGIWEECDWTVAFQYIATELHKIAQGDSSPSQIGAVASPSATTEELFILQKYIRGLGSHNIDHRVHQSDFSDQTLFGDFPGLPLPITDIAEQNKILMIGANIQREQPIAGHWLRQATLRNAEVMVINPVDYEYYFNISDKIIVNINEWPHFLAEVVQALINATDKNKADKYQNLLADITPSTEASQIADKLLQGDKRLILLGAVAMNHPKASIIRNLTRLMAELSGAKLGYLTEGANTAGAWLAGAVPHRTAGGHRQDKIGLDFSEMFAKPLKAYLLLCLEPDLDCANPALIARSLRAAEVVIALSAYKTEFLDQHATVLLPVVPFSETDGSYVNVEGRWQKFKAITQPLANARPAWKVLRVLGNFCNLPGFEYTSIEDIRAELAPLIPEQPQLTDSLLQNIALTSKSNGLTRITEWPLYRIDSLVRRSGALQESAASDVVAIHLNEKTAERYQLNGAICAVVSQGNGRVKLPIVRDARIPDNCIWLPSGYSETACLAEPFGDIEIMADHD